jgi:tetratricopeptide (TPR) repeat protein
MTGRNPLRFALLFAALAAASSLRAQDPPAEEHVHVEEKPSVPKPPKDGALPEIVPDTTMKAHTHAPPLAGEDPPAHRAEPGQVQVYLESLDADGDAAQPEAQPEPRGPIARVAAMARVPEGVSGVKRQHLLTPRQPCASNPEVMCYSERQLEKIADRIGGRWEDLSLVAHQVIPHPLESRAGDVRREDLQPVLDYLGDNQGMIDRIEGLLGQPWSELREEPDRTKQRVMRALRDDPELAQSMRDSWGSLKSQHDAIMSGGNPYHESLMTSGDTIGQKLMSMGPDGQPRPEMSGGEWAGAQPNNPAAHAYVANEALQNGDPAAAAEAARRALELDARNAAALSAMAAAQYELKDFAAAAAAARRALELDPNDAKAAAVLSLAHEMKLGAAPSPASGDSSAALASAAAPWRRVDVGDAKAAEARDAARRAEKMLSSGDYAGARAAIDRALAINPRSAYAHGLRAMAALKAGDAAQALRDAVAGLALDPNDKMALKARAQALLRLGRHAEALVAARAAVAADPRSGFARYLLAEAREANGDRAGALQALREAAALDARYKQIHDAALQVL